MIESTKEFSENELCDSLREAVDKIDSLEKQRDEYKALIEEKQKAIESHSIKITDLEKQLNRALHFMHTYKDYADYFQDLYEKLKQKQDK